jgi:hypothetical protein
MVSPVTPSKDMGGVSDILVLMRRSPAGVRFRDACKVADAYFGTARQKGTRHRVWKMPWAGDPRVNLQDFAGMAKPYQVRQLLNAIDRLQRERQQRGGT